MKSCIALLALLTLSVGAISGQSEDSKSIVEIAIGSPDHTTLVAALQAADLVEVLQGDGPFTVFAPTNAAFEKLPEGTVATLLKPENKAQLQSILKYHVVSGKLDAAAVVSAITGNNGKAAVTTLEGSELHALVSGDSVMLEDESGNRVKVIMTDLLGSNGIIHVVDGVVLPK